MRGLQIEPTISVARDRSEEGSLRQPFSAVGLVGSFRRKMSISEGVTMSTRGLIKQKEAIEATFNFLVEEQGYSQPQVQWTGDPQVAARDFSIIYESSNGTKVQVVAEDGSLAPGILLHYPATNFCASLSEILRELNLNPDVPAHVRFIEHKLVKKLVQVPLIGAFIFVLLYAPIWAYLLVFNRDKMRKDYQRYVDSCGELLRRHYDAIVEYAVSTEDGSRT